MFRRFSQEDDNPAKRRRLSESFGGDSQAPVSMASIDDDLRILVLRLKSSKHLAKDAAFIAKVGETFQHLSQFILEENGCAYLEWERRNYSHKKIAFHLYDLGLLAEASLVTVDVSVIEFLLIRLEKQPGLDAKSIAQGLYGVGLLANGNRICGQIDARLICRFLDKLHRCLPPSQSLSMTIYGVGHLARANNLVGQIDCHLVTELFVCLLRARDLNGQAISNSFYGVGLLARAMQLVGPIDCRLLSDLLVRALEVSNFDGRAIGNSLYGIGLLAFENQLSGQLNVALITDLLVRTLRCPSHDALTITNSLYGVGLLASSNRLYGQFDGRLITDMFFDYIRFGDLDVKNICTNIYALSFLITEHLEPKTELSMRIHQLLPMVFSKRVNETDADKLLFGLSRLMPGAACSGELLVPLFNWIMPRSYIHPSSAANLIHYMAFYRGYHSLLNDQFTALLSAITIPLNQFPARLQTQLQADIATLSDVSHWRFALMRTLGEAPPVNRGVLSNHRMSRIIGLDVVNEVIELSPRLHRVEMASSRFEFRNPRVAFPEPRFELDARRVEPALARVEAAQSAVHLSANWERAIEASPVFNAIAAKDINQLERLLGGIQARKTPRASIVSSVSGGSSGVPSIFRNEERAEDRALADGLAAGFLQETGALALRALVERSSFTYFELLFRACSQHRRYQLAQKNAMHVVLIHLPLKELEPMVVSLLGMGLYRDHSALLCLVDALTIRLSADKAMQATDSSMILSLRTKLLSRALEFHETSHHHHVIPRLTHAMERLVVNEASLCEEVLEAQVVTVVTDRAPALTLSSQSEPPITPVRSTLFASRHSGIMAPDLEYEYTSEDIQAILRARLHSYMEPHQQGVVVLASAHMDSQAQGNHVADVLGDYIRHVGVAALQDKKIIIPINKDHHWVGITVEVDSSQQLMVTYHNSAKNEAADEAFKHVIMQELLSLQVGGRPLFHGGVIRERHLSMQQKDGTSCGAFLIENIYCEIKGAYWSEAQLRQPLAQVIRLRHMEVLAAARPDYYPQFLVRQQQGLHQAQVHSA